MIDTLKQGSKSVVGRSRQSSARSSGEHDRLELKPTVSADAIRAELDELGIVVCTPCRHFPSQFFRGFS